MVDHEVIDLDNKEVAVSKSKAVKLTDSTSDNLITNEDEKLPSFKKSDAKNTELEFPPAPAQQPLTKKPTFEKSKQWIYEKLTSLGVIDAQEAEIEGKSYF